MEVQWYPGHMAKTKRLMKESLHMADAVCEIVDARIPLASRNPDITELSGEKPRLIILNRSDLADAEATAAWEKYFRANGMYTMTADSKSGDGVSAFPRAVRTLLREKIARNAEKGMTGKRLRVMVAGIPNVGKSSFINRVAGRRAAQAEDRPGVTRQNKWFSVDDGIELLDTPGILPPKISDPESGLLLAYTGAVKDEILDIETLACSLMHRLCDIVPETIAARYGVKSEDCEPDEFAQSPDIAHGYGLICAAAKKRGFLMRGGEPDTERMSKLLLGEFRSGALGKITLERPPESEK